VDIVVKKDFSAADEKKAALLLSHPDVWVDADKPYELRPLAREVASEAHEPRVDIIPQGGGKASPFWEPITIPVPSEVFDRVRDKELEVVFMTAADAEGFKTWKAEHDAKVARAGQARAAKAAKGLEAASA